MYSNVIVGITISRGSFMFSQSRVKVSASLTKVGSLAVGAFDLVNNYRRLTNDLSMTETKPTNGLLTDQLNNTRTKNRPIWPTIDGSKPTND